MTPRQRADEIEKALKNQVIDKTPTTQPKSFEEYWNSLEPKLEYFDYERELTQKLSEYKYWWIKKEVGLGITEYMLRRIAWRCNNDPSMKSIDVSVILITGPRIDLAIELIDRLKDIVKDTNETKNTVCIINDCKIQAFPSHHLSTAHGLNPRMVLLDEADLFPKGQWEEVRSMAERYITKSNPEITMVSTPYVPGGLYETIEREDPCLYRKMFLLYPMGLNKLYTAEQIEIAKQSPSFNREHLGMYGYGVGNIFQGVDEIIEDYDLNKIPSDICIFDPGFGSSMFGILGMGRLNDIAYVKEELELDRPSLSFAIQKCYEIAKNYSLTLVDGSQPGIIKDLQDKGINCVPINFGQVDENKQTKRSKMTTEAAQAVREKRVRIHKIFRNLPAQLRAVQFDKMGGPDKTKLNFDLGDCFLMGTSHLKTYVYREVGVSLEGKIIDFDRPKKSSLIMKTEVFE